MFAQIVALALAGSPEVVTLDVGEEPFVDFNAIHGEIDIRREGAGPVRLEARLPDRGGHRDEWIFQVKADGDRIDARVCCGPCNSKGNHDCAAGPVRVTGVLPERAKLELACVSAKVNIAGGSGEVNVSTVSGPVVVTRTNGEVSVNAVSANVKVAPAKTRDTKVNTVSGDVQLMLPEDTNAEVRFSTMSGRGPHRSVVGSPGGAEITVSTLSGDLKLRRADDR